MCLCFRRIGNVTGMGYELANIVIFVFLQPALILLFFILWRREVNKNKNEKIIIFLLFNYISFKEKMYFQLTLILPMEN